MLPGRTVTHMFHNLLCQPWTWLMIISEQEEMHQFGKALNEWATRGKSQPIWKER